MHLPKNVILRKERRERAKFVVPPKEMLLSFSIVTGTTLWNTGETGDMYKHKYDLWGGGGVEWPIYIRQLLRHHPYYYLFVQVCPHRNLFEILRKQYKCYEQW